MIAAALAFFSSVLTGGADFAAGISSRSIGALRTSFWSYLAATLLSVIALWFTAGQWTSSVVMLGLVAAVLGAGAFIAFYASLVLAPMGVVAAIVAASEAVVPVIVGVGWNGESLTMWGWIGIAAAVVGAIIVGAAEGGRGGAGLRAVLLAVCSGIAFGGTVVALGAAPASSGLIAPTLEMAGGLALIGALLWAVRALSPIRRTVVSFGLMPEAPAPGRVGFALLAGSQQGLANIVLMFALWAGQLAVVGVILCLYPITTAILARVILKENLTRIHILGIGVALLGCVLLGLA